MRLALGGERPVAAAGRMLDHADLDADCVSVAVSAFTAHKDLTTIVMEFRDEFPSFAAIQVVLVGIRRLCVDIEDR